MRRHPPTSRLDRWAAAVIAAVVAVGPASAGRAQEGAVALAGPDAYIARPIGPGEAVALSIVATEPLPSRVLSVIDEEGAEVECVVPCTVGSRAGRLTLRGERLDRSIDASEPGLAYDVTVAAGPEAGLMGLGVAMTLGGALALGLGIWGLTEPGLDEDLVTAAAVGAVFGGIFALIGLPMTIWMLGTLNGQASVTGYRVAGALVGTSFRF